MEYRQLGKSGLKVSELSFGSWITFGSGLDLNEVKLCMRVAHGEGVNFFDTAEGYGNGLAEELMGEAIKEYRREDLVISTKVYWGGRGPNDTGLSWKHVIEGTKNSLKRLQLDYLDMLFCHRADPHTPIEETVRAMDVLIRQGLIFYWGTSEWSRDQIEEAYRIAKEIGATPPSMEQPEYNMFRRQKVEHEFLPLYKKYGMGITSWSPLDSGILTGKYSTGLPAGSRLQKHEELRRRLTEDKILKVKNLMNIAKELNCTMGQLAIAWCLLNPHVSSVITGATNTLQMQENMAAVHVKKRITEDSKKQIEEILQSKFGLA